MGVNRFFNRFQIRLKRSGKPKQEFRVQAHSNRIKIWFWLQRFQIRAEEFRVQAHQTSSKSWFCAMQSAAALSNHLNSSSSS
jgi:hypothetical protein